MDELLEYIYRLENDSFECWSEGAENGYRTACGSIKAKLEEIMSDRHKRKAVAKKIFKLDMADDIKDIVKRRFK